VNQQPTPQGLEPLEEVEAAALPTRPRTVQESLRLNIRGRSVRLRGLRRTPKGFMRYLLILGPGLIAASAGVVVCLDIIAKKFARE
jgi:hypothetical protein